MVLNVKISNITIAVALYIILSASFMRYVLNFMTKNIAESGVSIVMWVIFAIVIALIIVYLCILRPKILNIFLFLLVFSAGLYYAFKMEIMVERWHLIQFGLLGGLIARDSDGIKNRFHRLLFSMFFGLLIASLDETFQLFLPNRVADVRDIVTGTIGSVWGALTYLVCLRRN